MRPELIENPVFLRYYEKWQKEPTSVVFAAISELFRTNNMLDEAVAVAKEGLKHHPNLVSGHLALAKAYLAKGEKLFAKEEAIAILGFMPNNIEALAVLELAGERGRWTVDSGQGTGSDVVASHPHESGDLVHLNVLDSPATLPAGGRFRGNDNTQYAIRMTQDEEDITEEMPLAELEEETEVRSASEHEAWHTLTMAQILARQGHFIRARKIFKKILDREPGNEAAKEELNKLE